jgi:hypothetical protein
MVLSQKLYLEEHLERTKAGYLAEIDQLKQTLDEISDKHKKLQERLHNSVNAESQTHVDSNRWNDMVRVLETMKDTIFRQTRELT